MQEPILRKVKPRSGKGSRRRALRMLDGFGVGLICAWMDVQAAAFVAVQRARVAPAEGSYLNSGLVNGSVAVDSF